MALPTYKELLESGAHLGHMKRKWNPKMLPYIFMERKGIHIIDLNRTMEFMDKAASAIKQVAKSGRKVMFVATKKQAKESVAKLAREANMPYVTERWLGGMMTNFSTIKRSVKKMNSIDKLLADENVTSITKKERLTLTRERNKLEKVLGGIANMNRLPAAIFVVDIHHEHIAIAEAKKLGIKIFGIVDTNSDPTSIDFPIPANDDASKSIKLITSYIAEVVKEGTADRKKAKEEKKESVAS
ncbi:MAG: 30S ribosomal protein S2 [Saprospiraceae bacterium]|nr:30S ribosomal protein S2 [Bacteroidia bacterium]NNE13410.1 30S ribosomal protein S2 [Saprospiraceae bacterium]NNL92046.1 30S ribosomal protein S2 [Saprospiraceae bacterium]